MSYPTFPTLLERACTGAPERLAKLPHVNSARTVPFAAEFVLGQGLFFFLSELVLAEGFLT